MDQAKFDRHNLLFASSAAMDSALFRFRDMPFYDAQYKLLYKLLNNGDSGYRLTDWLVCWLLAKDVLRLEDVHLPLPVKSRSPMKKDELPVESFVKLALFTGSPISQKRAEEWDLNGSQMEKLNLVHVDQGLELIDHALNMNPKKLQIVERLSHFGNFIAPKLSGTVSERMKSFLVIFTMSAAFSMINDMFPHEQLRAFVDNILVRCPKLEKLIIITPFGRNFSTNNFDPYVHAIDKLNKTLTEELASLETNECELIIFTEADFPSQTLNDAVKNEHDVMKMGVHCEDELSGITWKAVISRKMTLKEKVYARHSFFPRN